MARLSWEVPDQIVFGGGQQVSHNLGLSLCWEEVAQGVKLGGNVDREAKRPLLGGKPRVVRSAQSL